MRICKFGDGLRHTSVRTRLLPAELMPLKKKLADRSKKARSKSVAQRQLHQSRRHGAHSLPKLPLEMLPSTARGAEKLRVIEDIECLGAKFERAIVSSREIPRERRVEILHAGAGKEAPARIAHGSQARAA